MVHPRRGTTLVELLLVLSVTSVIAAIIVRGMGAVVDALAVHAAAGRVADLLALARDHAVASGERTAVRFDTGAHRVVVHARGDTLARDDLSAGGAVRLGASRDSIAYGTAGLGYGAANVRIVLTRGASSDTITVSRAGRVKRGA